MATIEKLIQKALKSPQNLRFQELCSLCEHFGMKRRNKRGKHIIYKREEPPKFSLPIQNNNGKAVPYQVKQLIDKIREHNLYDLEEDD